MVRGHIAELRGVYNRYDRNLAVPVEQFTRLHSSKPLPLAGKCTVEYDRIIALPSVENII
jgi:hypothetical protein